MKELKSPTTKYASEDTDIISTVSRIIDDVRKNGDRAVAEYTRRFDGSDRDGFRVTEDEIQAAYAKVSSEQLADLKSAKANIVAFAKAQLASMSEVRDFSPMPGIYLGHRIIPVDSCCCYVPGGRYPLFSTALMLITPARVAGVRRIVATSPVSKGTGTIDPMTLVAMDLAGADEIYAIGGAQAIAAFSYGTERIEPVSLIVGPGNSYVTEAKRQCFGQVGIDFVAGPSEVLIIADEKASADVIAADLLAQCEHDPSAKACLITTSESLAKATLAAVEEELVALRTADVASISWTDNGQIILAEELDEACAIANEQAPEHLELNISDPESVIDKLINYGSLFIGENTAEAFGDYASGTNHTLPTLGASRYTGGLWAGTFVKVCTDQRMDPAATSSIAPLVARMARAEGLEAHAIAAEKRCEK